MRRSITNLIIILSLSILIISCMDKNREVFVNKDKPYLHITKNSNQPINTINDIRATTNTITSKNNKRLLSDTLNIRERKEYLISPNDNKSLSHTGVTLFIQDGVVKKPTLVSITPIPEPNLPPISNNMVNLTNYHNGYRFLPDGQTFEKELTMALSYDSTQIPYGYTSKDIYTYFYNEDLKIWQQIERDSVDELNHIIYSRTNHFTDYINGILKTPESSDVMAYTPTSIKDLEAIHPLNGITTISPPQANNKGTANLSYPITIPQGRRGMQPDLNITYNSSGGSSWLGLGWDLSVSCISVETRWGVPLYNPDKESETYLLDGETLVTGYERGGTLILNKPNYRLKWDTISRNYDGVKQFYPRVEGSFKKIIRHGTDPGSYWWEVIDKNGTKYYYGSIDGENKDNSSVFRNYTSNNYGLDNYIAKWHLKKVIDVYGNTINYNYKLINTDGYQVVLDYITYTGFEPDEEASNNEIFFDSIDLEGMYKVIFKTSNKPDKSTSYRYGFMESNSVLLDKIQVLYDTDTIKEYFFGFKEGGFAKSLLCTVIETDMLEAIL